jgi:hypothetical protein
MNRTVSTMTWSETKRRWRMMREIEELFVVDPSAQLPWTEEHVELFGDRDGLVAALRYRWQLARDAQLDSHVPEAALDEQRIRMERRTRTMLRILDTVASGDQGGDRAVA